MTLQKTVAELPLETPVEDNGGEWNLLDLSVIDRHSLERQVCQAGISARNANLSASVPALAPEGDRRHMLEGSPDGINAVCRRTFASHP